MCRQIFSWIVCAVAVLATAAQTRAEAPPANLLSDTIAPGINLAAKPSRALRMGSLHIAIEETTLSYVGSETGNVLRRHFGAPGQAAGTFEWLCFTVEDGETLSRIWLTSDDEMEGGEHIGSILAMRLPRSAIATDECPALQARFKPIQLDKGIWLGSSSKDLARALGAEPSKSDGWSSFTYTGTVTLIEHKKRVPFDVINDLEVDMHGGVVTSLRFGQITSG